MREIIKRPPDLPFGRPNSPQTSLSTDISVSFLILKNDLKAITNLSVSRETLKNAVILEIEIIAQKMLTTDLVVERDTER